MTSARIFITFDSNNMEIKSRRLDQDTFRKAKLKLTRPQWDLALLKIKVGKLNVCECESFSEDGTLRAGQPILTIGRTSNFVGSCRYGNSVVGLDPAEPEPENIKLYEFERQIHPHVPVIQCDGFSINNDQCFGSPESQGSPVFNLTGEIVGMLSSKFHNFDIAIHVEKKGCVAKKKKKTQIWKIPYVGHKEDMSGSPVKKLD
ncbi:hypothetical protein POM88_000225 [Heracleum sosnowskyi]|uniref:Uncharacterized protein n=1 Tax=Heracleum sosnowskyi TaxID=360622 RepID=A0AAD8N3T7_9APIA|nr:hypothetical protein POM88_000225 [Heracleum sosnowskyi]